VDDRLVDEVELVALDDGLDRLAVTGMSSLHPLAAFPTVAHGKHRCCIKAKRTNSRIGTLTANAPPPTKS